MKLHLLTLACLGSGLAPASAGQVALIEDGGAGLSHVRTYDEVTGVLTGAPMELQGIRLLTFEVNERTQVTRFLPGRTRWYRDVPGATRAELPNSLGSVYHYARPDPLGSVDFGFFLVDPNGSARVLIELNGVGFGGILNPFVGRLAFAPQGDALLVATVPAAGGNALEVSLGPVPAVFDRTANLPTRRFFGTGLHLADTWGFVIGKRGVLRFDRLPGATVNLVTTQGSPAPLNFTGHAVFSEARTRAVFTAGDTPATLSAYVFSSSGPALLATPTPMPLSGAGYLPEAADGPHLAVNDDGTLVAWRTEGVSREGWLGRVQAPATDPALEYSSDSLFLDTLDEVGIFVFRPGNKLNMAVGSQAFAGANEIESTDFFTVDASTAVSTANLTNLSLSSGVPTAPFFAVPSITPQQVTLSENNTGLWFHDSDPQHGVVSVVQTGVAGATPVLTNVKDLDNLVFSAGWAVLSIRRSDGARPYELWSVPQDLSAPATLILTEQDVEFARFATTTSGRVAYVKAKLTSEALLRVQLQTGVLETWSPNPGFYGPTLANTALGGVAFSELSGPGGTAVFKIWTAAGTAVVLQSPSSSGFVLPGA